jgi:hypothetical protein
MRKDVHRPAEFVPEDYVCVGYLSHANSDMEGMNSYQREQRIRLLQLIQNSKSTAYHSGYQCDHCGAHLTYVAVFMHQPTEDFLAIGEVCAEGRFEYSKAEFDRMRKEAQLDREKQRIKKAWDAFKAKWSTIDWDGLYASSNSFIQDVLRRGRQYGSISEKQINALCNALKRDEEYAERKANEVEVPKMAVVNGKQTVEGQIVSTRLQESQFGTVMKMLVVCQGSEGEFKLWGSVPTFKVKCEHVDPGCYCYSDAKGNKFAYASVGVGDVVRFNADVSASADDPFFGFFKRPTKASVVGVQYKCDKCDATVIASDADGAVGWYFDEDAYLCPVHRPVESNSVARFYDGA